MEQDNVKDRLDHSRYGTPNLKPDEQKRYLGTFRERCVLTMTLDEMRDPVNKEHLKNELAQHDDLQVLLNGDLPESIQNDYIALLAAQKNKFTIIDNAATDEADTFGLVVSAKEAVNEPVVDIEEKYS